MTRIHLLLMFGAYMPGISPHRGLPFCWWAPVALLLTAGPPFAAQTIRVSLDPSGVSTDVGNRGGLITISVWDRDPGLAAGAAPGEPAAG